MSSFIALRKTFDLSSDANRHLLVGRQNRDIPTVAAGGAIVTTIKRHYDYTVDVSFDSQGGTACSLSTYTLGGTYKNLPTPTRSQHIFNGWVDANGQTITTSTAVQLSTTSLSASWEYVEITGDYTSYLAVATSSYRNTGIYQANRYSSASAVYIDWGDGTVEKVNGNISKLAHTYSSNGNYTVKINNNITSFAPSYNDSTWYSTTSHSRYTFKDITKVGSRLTSFPSYGFYYCSALSSINWLSSFTGMTQIPSYAFYYCTALNTLSALASTNIRSTATYAFSYCQGIKNLSGIENLTSLGSYSFYYCTGLSSISQLSDTTLTSLPSYCFYYCQSIKSLAGIEKMRTLEDYCFYYCTGLTGNLDLEALPITSLTQSSIFRYCSNITAVTLPSAFTGTYFGSYMFGNCSNLRSFTFPNQVTAVGSNMFYQCSQLSSVQMTDNIRTINSYAFYQCNKLSSIDLPNALTSIQSYAFYYCQALVSIDIPDTVTTIGNYCFYYNNLLSSISLPTSLTSLTANVLQGCYNLGELSIPANVSTIGSYALAGCYRLSVIYALRSASAPTTQNYSFGYQASNSQRYGYTGYSTRGSNTLYVPAGCTSMYNTSYWSSRLLNASQCGFAIQEMA